MRFEINLISFKIRYLASEILGEKSVYMHMGVKKGLSETGLISHAPLFSPASRATIFSREIDDLTLFPLLPSCSAFDLPLLFTNGIAAWIVPYIIYNIDRSFHYKAQRN